MASTPMRPSSANTPKSPSLSKHFNAAVNNSLRPPPNDSREEALGPGLEGDEYIARIRYDNSLPPPPCPPKLLRIPGEGVPDHYLTPAFTSRLARQQDPNIELDAFLGMPIDLLGMPGAMEGDLSSIEAQINPPPVDERDYPLLQPVSSLSKKKQAASNASFLRRTEFLSADQGRLRSDGPITRKSPSKSHTPDATTQAYHDLLNEDPARIAEDVEMGFIVANASDRADSGLFDKISKADLEAWDNPQHPVDPRLTVLDEYPLLPDPEAVPDTGGYMVMKFKSNPSTAPNGAYDRRLNTGVFRPLPLKPEYVRDFEAKRAAHQVDASQPDPGQPKFDYEFFIANDQTASDAIDRQSQPRMATQDDIFGEEEREDPDEQQTFHFDRVRAYETHQQSGDGDDPYDDNVVISLCDGDSGSRVSKAAYFYPVSHRAFLRPRRMANVGRVGLAANTGDEDKVDRLDVSIGPVKETHRADHQED